MTNEPDPQNASGTTSALKELMDAGANFEPLEVPAFTLPDWKCGPCMLTLNDVAYHFVGQGGIRKKIFRRGNITFNIQANGVLFVRHDGETALSTSDIAEERINAILLFTQFKDEILMLVRRKLKEHDELKASVLAALKPIVPSLVAEELEK